HCRASSDHAGRPDCAGPGTAAHASYAPEHQARRIRRHSGRHHASDPVAAPLLAYLDTSAVMALLLGLRPGHAAVESVWRDADEVATVHVAPVEVRAALIGERAG